MAFLSFAQRTCSLFFLLEPGNPPITSSWKNADEVLRDTQIDNVEPIEGHILHVEAWSTKQRAQGQTLVVQPLEKASRAQPGLAPGSLQAHIPVVVGSTSCAGIALPAALTVVPDWHRQQCLKEWPVSSDLAGDTFGHCLSCECCTMTLKSCPCRA